MTSPTQRSLKRFRDDGIHAQVVEQSALSVDCIRDKIAGPAEASTSRRPLTTTAFEQKGRVMAASHSIGALRQYQQVGSIIRIPLNRGRFTIVDADTPRSILEKGWYTCGKNNYVTHITKCDGKRVGLLLHREICGAKKGEFVDHINGDPLDNRLSNLRICTNQQNTWNQKKKRKGKSRFKGVAWVPHLHKWTARLTKNGKNLYLGLFTDEADAARAYDNAAKLHYGEYARGNDYDANPANA